MLKQKPKMDEKKTAQSGTRGLQRDEKEKVKAELRHKILSIRQGHTTGGYCDSEALKAEEKKLDKVIRVELAEAIEKHGYSADPKYKHKEVREIEVELNGLSWKPTLVVKDEN